MKNTPTVVDPPPYAQLFEAYPASGLQEVPAKTFLEIGGYPHAEEQASNILKFFFDNREEHKLGSLFLRSLLECAGVDVAMEDLDVEAVRREVTTEKKTRLDLVISTSTLLVGIENKLFHQLNNDLSIYKQHLEMEAQERKVLGILLSLEPIPSSIHKNVFLPVTYSSFFEVIRKNMGTAVIGASQQYLPFLLDFIQSIEHLSQETAMPNLEYRKWVHDHQQEICTLFRDVTEFSRQLRQTAGQLKNRIDLSGYEGSGIGIKPWLYDASEDGLVAQVLVYDIELPDHVTFAIDVIHTALDWKITVVGRQPATFLSFLAFIKKMPGITSKKISLPGDTNYPRLQVGLAYYFDADLDVLAEKVQDLLNRILKAGKKLTRVVRP
jgi:hypothetical protein